MEYKEVVKKTKKIIDDQRVFQLIREENTANDIIKETGININTLRNKLITVMTKDNQVYKIEGINEPSRTIKSNKKGINIPKRNLDEAPFEILDDDTFSIKWNKDEKTILLAKR